MGNRRCWLIVVAFFLAGCSHEPPPYESHYTEPPSAAVAPVAIIGDSYTGGSDMGGKADKGWPAVVKAQLYSQGINIAPELGTDGGSGYVKPGIKGQVFADQIPKVVGPNEKLVVLFGSRNDTDEPDLGAAVQRTLAAVRTAAPDAKLLVIGPPWVDGNPPTPILQIRDTVKAQADAAGATFVDPIAEGWFAGQPDLIGADGIHPNDTGHAYMAGKIAPDIAEQLKAPPAIK